ncbi:MAG: hypothetical protein LQ342_004413 [Letrouitia transgressa]|nr:MAG: hypothetical protein LQ342_004413 [Letrouitia transgressa]
MVLNTSPSSEFYDASPENTADAYDSSSSSDFWSSNNQSYYVSLGQLSQPFPLIGPLFGYTQQYRARALKQRLLKHTEVLGRPLLPKEVDSIVYHSNKGIVYASYGTPISFAIGCQRAWASRETSKFPFVGEVKQEGSIWDGQRIRVAGRDLLKGETAKRFMLGLRLSVYGGLWMVCGSIFFASYAGVTVAVGEMRDPILREFNTALNRKLTQGMKAQEANKDSNEIEGPGPRNAGEYRKYMRQKKADQDDASPSAEGFDYGANGANETEPSDSQIRSQKARQQIELLKSSTTKRASDSGRQTFEREPVSFSEDFDDASPAGGSRGVGDQNGTAWDRIRRQASNPSGEVQQRGPRQTRGVRKEQQAGSTSGGSFTFSNEEEERQLAKDEAQKDFDARLERERQGGDFSSSPRSGRW